MEVVGNSLEKADPGGLVFEGVGSSPTLFLGHSEVKESLLHTL